MSIDIAETLYRRTDIRLSTRLAALELARQAQPDGTVVIAYRYLARAINVCLRTAFRTIERLGVDAQLITKRVRRRHGSAFHEVNIYKFTCPFRRPRAFPAPRHTAQTSNGDSCAKMPSNPRNPEEERTEKLRILREEVGRQEKALHWICTPGSDAYQRCQEEISRLQGLIDTLQGTPQGAPEVCFMTGGMA